MTVGGVYDLAPGSAATAEVGRSDTEFARFALPYRIAVSMLTTKVSILKEKFTDRDGYCPIAAVSSRVKTLDSIRRKAQRIRCPLAVDVCSQITPTLVEARPRQAARCHVTAPAT